MIALAVGALPSACSPPRQTAEIDRLHEHAAGAARDCSTPLAMPRSPDELGRLLHPTNGHGPFVLAHRGGAYGKWPENSIAGCRNALSLGAVLIEVDVRSTADGVLVLLHDESLERTTTGHGSVGEVASAELSGVRLVALDGSTTRQPLPRLRDALAWAKGKAILWLDVKPGVAAARVVSAIRDTGVSHQVIIGVYDSEARRRYARLAPELVYATPATRLADLSDITADGLSLARLVILTGWEPVDWPLVLALRRKGLPSVVNYTQRTDPAVRAGRKPATVYAEALKRGAAMVTSDNLREVVDQLCLH